MIAAITSCTNTSNPSVMVAAGLVAKKAVERGLDRKPWVKSSLAPGSKVVTEYYEKAGLTPALLGRSIFPFPAPSFFFPLRPFDLPPGTVPPASSPQS